MSTFFSQPFGPRLYRLYGDQSTQFQTQPYLPNLLEAFGNKLFQAINIMWCVGVYTSPLIVTYLYKREYGSMLGLISLAKFTSGMGLLYVVAICIRGFGRYLNPVYGNFIRTLEQVENKQLTKAALYKYDFDFSAWPIDFVDNIDVPFEEKEENQCSSPETARWVASLPCRITGYLCVHLFGRHLLYPGSVQLFQFILDEFLQKGREKLVVSDKGIRNKVVTKDGNFIDTMFIDRRNSKKHENGSMLVVCCEGNAGFYEMGVMSTPLEAGYSVLGWNHPGFAGSSGTPFPSEEQNAVESVMQFAIHSLGFKEENIVIYAWSIGGYVGTWAARKFQNIRGLVLDATFDDVLPLAIPKMPSWMGGIVSDAVRRHMNLNNAEQLAKYSGPVTIIRRTNDEVITVVEGDISTNRGNHLLVSLLKRRYPQLQIPRSNVMLERWLSGNHSDQAKIVREIELEDDHCLTLLSSYIEAKNKESNQEVTFPIHIGDELSDDQKIQMLIFLARKYMVDFPNSHNNPLEPRYFRLPWNPLTDASWKGMAPSGKL